MADIKNGAITIEGIDALNGRLKALQTDNPGFDKRIRAAIREILIESRKQLVSQSASGLKMQGDPRQAYKAVKTAVYRRVLGGSVSLLNRRKAGARLPEPPVVHQMETRTNSKGNHRGGNRMPRSQRTIDLMTYSGADRAFILRFLNQGTDARIAGTRDGKINAKRGAIAPRKWFQQASTQQLQQAAGKIEELITKIINEQFI